MTEKILNPRNTLNHAGFAATLGREKRVKIGAGPAPDCFGNALQIDVSLARRWTIGAWTEPTEEDAGSLWKTSRDRLTTWPDPEKPETPAFRCS